MMSNSTTNLITTTFLCFIFLVSHNLSFAIDPPNQNPIALSHDSSNSPLARQIILKFKANYQDFLPSDNKLIKLQKLKQRLNSNLRHFILKESLLADQYHVILVTNNSINIKALIQAIKNTGMVSSVEQDLIAFPVNFSSGNSYPNDPLYNQQWSFFENIAGANVEAAWSHASGNGVTVGVIDTGYLPHEDLPAVIAQYDLISSYTIDPTSSSPYNISRDGDGRDPDATDEGDWIESPFACGYYTGTSPSSWHSTHVNGTIAALTDNSQGVAGIAYNAQLVIARVLGRCGGLFSDINAAIIWTSGGTVPGIPNNPNPANVINLSLGGLSDTCPEALQAAIDDAVSRGTTVVVAAGNSSDDVSGTTPANCNNVIVVGASDRFDGGLTYYSNYGSLISLMAPGGDFTKYAWEDTIGSTLNTGATTAEDDTYVYYQGTSMAAPHVTSAAAFLYELKPNITPSEVKMILTNTTKDFPVTSNCDTTICGTGLLDVEAAVLALKDDPGGNDETTITLQTNLSGSSPSFQQVDRVDFNFTLPANANSLTISTSDGTGKVTGLFLSQDADFGGTKEVSCWSRNPNTTEQSCIHSDLNTSKEFTATLTVRNGSYSGVTLKYRYTYPSGE